MSTLRFTSQLKATEHKHNLVAHEPKSSGIPDCLLIGKLTPLFKAVDTIFKDLERENALLIPNSKTTSKP